ncbi:hypothetical protein RND81_09G223900 [Saponaria officinalis]|uniref:Major facilitator superfamily (MFS) profile domain-containing protein n=1 Tax=Saponaria officinalis TaxID=3572 RepID=A0AAW1IQB2_SAPOF
MKEETRVHLLDSNIITNNNLHKLDDDANNNNNNADEAAIVDSLNITPTLLLTTFFTLLGSLSLGFTIGYIAPVQSEIIEELGLSTSENSLFVSINNVGSAMGAILCGKLADYLGRRRALGLADILYVLGWLSIAVAQDAWLLDLGRWMLGVAMSICTFVIPIYIAEFAPQNLRGGFVVLYMVWYMIFVNAKMNYRLLFQLLHFCFFLGHFILECNCIFMQLMCSVGSSLVFLLGLIVPWRTLALIGIIPSLVQIISVFFIPESPRWLMMIGKNEEFEAALRQFRGAAADISQEVFDIKMSAEALQEKPKVSLLQLLQKKYAYTLTVGIGLIAFSVLVGVTGVLAYSRSIFESAGLSGITGMVSLSVMQLPSVVLAIILTDKCGRRPLLMISSVGVCVGCLLTASAFTFQVFKQMLC